MAVLRDDGDVALGEQVADVGQHFHLCGDEAGGGDGLCEDAQAFQKEAERRVTKMNRPGMACPSVRWNEGDDDRALPEVSAIRWP